MSYDSDIDQQDDLMLKILKLAKKHKNDLPSKYSIGYFNTFIKTLSDYWITFKANHERLVKLVPKTEWNETKYFCDNHYEDVEDAVLDTTISLENQKEKLELLQNEQEARQRECQKNMEIQKEIVDGIAIIINKIEQDDESQYNVGYFKTRIQNLEKEWTECREQHLKLTTIISKEKQHGIKYFANSQFEEIRERVTETLAFLENKKDEMVKAERQTFEIKEANESQTIRNNSSSNIQLPRMSIEHFSGDYKKWITFRSVFRSMIHDDMSLNNIQKLHILKNHLNGEASQVIRHIPITENSYQQCWELLENRYENKRALVYSQLKTLTTQPTITNESSNSIRRLLDNTIECIQNLNNLEVDTVNWDPILVYIISHKLDSETQKLWESSLKDPKAVPTFDDLTKFLESRFLTLDNIYNLDSKGKYSNRYENRQVNNGQSNFYRGRNGHASNNHQSPVQRVTHFQQNYRRRDASPRINTRSSGQFRSSRPRANSNPESPISFMNCPICRTGHSIFNCPTFRNESPSQRKLTSKFFSLCLNCLRNNHETSQCKAPQGCIKCKEYHSTLLHEDAQTQQTRSQQSPPPTPSTSKPNPFRAISNHQTASSHESFNTIKEEQEPNTSTILLATALVEIKTLGGYNITLRALLDQGSQCSFITQSAADSLKLPKKRVTTQITGVGEIETNSPKSSVQITVQSRIKEFEMSIEAFIIPSITKFLPSHNIVGDDLKHINGLQLADPTFNKRGRIDMLLGADMYAYILDGGIIKGAPGSPVAQSTELGWILSGHITNHVKHNRLISLHQTVDLDQQLKKFWEIEDIEITQPLSIEDRQCEEFYEKTHQRREDGRYIVQLPFKGGKDCTPLGASRAQALSRFRQLEARFRKNSDLKGKYQEFIKEYYELGHMTEIRSPKMWMNDNKHCYYYLPHHAIIKEDSTTTKLRVVFDASAKTDTGISLNETMLTGPTLQQDMASIIMRWRKHKISFTADIAKMYRQILVKEEDQDYQRILWREHELDNITEYKLTTVTYGTSSAPYLAIKTLRQLALDEQPHYPLASEATLNDFYVDDIMSGTDSIDEAINLQEQLINLLNTGGMELRKWSSNSKELLNNIPEAYREISLSQEIRVEETIKTLGIHWHPAQDHLQFKVKLTTVDAGATKRKLISEVAKLYDPLGWLAPTIIVAKMLFQGLWLRRLEWDEELPQDIKAQWNSFRMELPLLEEIRIPRWIQTTLRAKHELHGFSDASNMAYAAVVYIRSLHPDGNITVQLLTAKTKVAPIKVLTLPRLELQGAVLVAKLLHKVKGAMQLETVDHFWTDSTIVLAWLSDHPTRWTTFVGNRTSEILTLTNIHQWHHVSSQDNPADCATRGIPASQLKEHGLWWKPPILMKRDTDWSKHNANTEKTKVELKTKYITTLSTSTPKQENYILSKFSSLTKLLHIISWCNRFKSNTGLNKADRITTEYLQQNEINASRIQLLKIAQDLDFHVELNALKRSKSVPNKSKLFALNPFIDGVGLIRIGGRIPHSTLEYDEKHPIILSHQNHLSQLIIKDAHIRTMHGGTQATLGYIRNTYWIINARNAVKKHIHDCMICFRFNAKPNTQLMGDLPRPRLLITRPFTNVGVDYAGPMNIRLSKGRGTKSYKGYIALFVCLSTKAIHLEVVSDLTSHAFIAAFKRFVSRRGLPTNVYSDNGTNFVGANNIMKNRNERMNHNKKVTEVLSQDGIQWHFIPPFTPHFGGLWESGVKSTKRLLIKHIQNSTLTFEELYTVLTQVEACLNSRPLCALTDDPQDFTALTPGHFLIGGPLISTPTADYTQSNITSLTRWKMIEKLHQDIWKRWSTEYLSGLQQRPKWARKKNDIHVGELVLLREESLPPTKWSLGRITQLHSGADGLTRVVTVRTQSSDKRMALNRISSLPSTISDENLDPNSSNDSHSH